MAQYLDIEGLKVYDKSVKSIISIKNVKDVSKVKADEYPDGCIIQYTGPEVLEAKKKLTIGDFTFIVTADDVQTLDRTTQLTATAEDGVTYTLKYANEKVSICPGPIFDETRLVGSDLSLVAENVDIPSLTPQQFYKVKYFGTGLPTFTRVEIGVDAGSIALDHDVTSNVTAGAINPGDVVKEGTNFSDFVRKLLTKEIAPTLSLKLTVASGIYQITADGISLSKVQVDVTKNSAASIDSVVFISPDGTEIPMALQGTSWICSPSETYKSDAKFEVVATYKKSDNVTTGTVKATASYKFINPIILGVGQGGVYASLNLADPLPTGYTTSLVEAAGKIEYPVNTNNSEAVILVPGTNKYPTSVKDKNGFEYVDIFKKNSKIIKVTDLSGAEVDYTMMWSKTATLTGSFAYIFTF